ncbi:MAG: FUSC family protein [Terracidiphilus sp.]|nr:FUSC family protein [Terracidiphilus sp.]
MPARSQSAALPARAMILLRQMDWYRGLRAAIALCAPLVLGDLLSNSYLAWAALGGFEAIISDQGGPYRHRLGSISTVAFGGALGLTLGSLAGSHLLWALPVTVLFCFLWSYSAVLGPPFAGAGTLVQVIYICGIGMPSDSPREAITRGLFLAAGGLWAAALSLLLWPLDPYRQARAAVSGCYSEMASFLNSISQLAARGSQNPALWHRLAQHHQYRLRQVVERGWQALASVRASRQTETPQGQQLVVLLEHADLLLARSIAIAEHMEAQSGCSSCSECQQHYLTSLDDLRSVSEWIASLLIHRAGLTMAHARAQRSRMRRLPAFMEGTLCAGNTGGRFLLDQIAASASLLDSSVDSAALLRLGKLPDHVETLPQGASVGHFAHVHLRMAQFRSSWSLARVSDQLRANFATSSLLLRHAARIALVCGLDILLIFLIHIDHGYWLLLTSLIVLQPHVSGTMRRGFERILGTVGGGILAAVLAIALHSQLSTAAALFPLALLSLAILPVNYALFSFFLTPTFVLAWLPYSGDWQLALLRTGNTVIGAIIAVAAMHFLFPSFERERAPAFLRSSLAADRRYLAQLADNWRTGLSASRLLANARRSAGLAHNDTEESMDRLLAESWPRRPAFAQFVPAFVTYLRRAAQSVTVLAAIDGNWPWKQSPAVRERLDLSVQRLAWLESQIEPRLDPESAAAPWPEPAAGSLCLLDDGSSTHPGERQLERLERQVEILRRQLHTLRQSGWLPGSRPEPAAAKS